MFNNALLMAAAASGDSLVQIGNSALFDDANSEYLSRTPSSAGNLRKWTLSLWAYRCNLGTGEFKIWSAISGSNFDMVAFSGNELGIEINTSTSTTNSLRSNALFRDQGWYHIVVVWDSDNAISTNRIRAWVNGERITSWRAGNFPGSAGVDSLTNSTVLHTLGAKANVSQYFDGYLAESVLIDGLALEPTSFGQYDSTGTFWTPLSNATIKGLTFGTNGFYLDNTTNAETDASGEGNNFTNNNTVTTSTHTPTQLWPIFNAAGAGFSSGVSDGNTKVTYGAAGANYSIISFPGTGKFVAQCTADDVVSNGIGWVALNADGGVSTSNALVLNEARWIGLTGGNWIHSQYVDFVGGTNLGTVKTSASDGDILQLEWDNGTLTVQINGTRYTPSNWTAVDTSLNWAFLSRCAGNGTETWDFGQDGFTPHDTSYSYVNTTTLASAITRTKSNLEEYFDSTLYEGNGAGQRVGKFLPFTDTFTVGNSGLFKLVSTSQDSSNARLTRTQDAGASVKKFSFSFWFKRGLINNTNQYIYSDEVSLYSGILINTSNQIEIFCFTGASTVYKAATTRVITDTSQWNHIVINIDTSQATAADRQEIYLNGVDQPLTISNQISQDNTSFTIGTAVPIGIGSFISNSSPRLPFDGYLAEFVYINNVNLAASNFGQVDTSTGRWIPKSLSGLSFDATGFYLNFATLGEDVSGNDNDFTNANVVQADDTPTVNFAVFDANFVQSGFVLSNGNQTADASSTNKWGTITLPITTGKWFGVATTTDANSRRFGVASNEEDFVNLGSGVIPTDDEYAWAVALSNDTTIVARNDSTNVTGTIQTIDRTNDRYAVAIDCDNRKVWLGVYDNSAGNIQWIDGGGTVRTTDVPASGVNETYILTGTSWRFFAEHGGTGSAQTIDFGQSSFGGASLPSGFLGLNQDNMPEGESYLTAFSWIKNRDATDSHMLFDRVRGIYNDLHSDAAVSQVTNVNTLQRFLNGGVQVGNDVQVNTASESYVAWNWYMETAGSGTSNTDGSTNTEATLVDTNLGLSISKFDSGASGDHTIGHGLGVVPEFVIFKELESANNWAVYHSGAGFTDTQDYLLLNTTSGVGDNGASIWGAAFPTSSVLGFTSGQICNVNKEFLAMAFAPSQFTSIGSYVGNGNANGAFIPTVNSLGVPIQPAWTIVKRTDAANSWGLGDGVRDPFNPVNQYLAADNNAAEASYSTVDKDYVLGGFKARGTSAGLNASGGTYIYMAFGTPIIDVDGRIITGR